MRISESFVRLILWSLAGTFLLVGGCFFLAPNGTVGFMNQIGLIFGFPEAPPIAQQFYLGLGTAYMAVVTVLAALAALRPASRGDLLIALAVGKAVSSLTCLWFYYSEAHYFIYLANFVVDGLLVFIVLWLRGQGMGGATVIADADVQLAGQDRPASALLRSVVEGYLSNGSLAAGLTETTARRVRGFFAVMPGGELGMGLLLRWLNRQPRRYGMRGRFAKLDADARAQVLTRLEEDPVWWRRQAGIALKLIVMTVAWERPQDFGLERLNDGWLQGKLTDAAEARQQNRLAPLPDSVL